jgi:hypothetical protein
LAQPPAQPPAQPNLPRCPRCETRPACVQTSPFEISPGMMAVAIYCANPQCGVLFGVQIVGPIPQPEQRIVWPS